MTLDDVLRELLEGVRFVAGEPYVVGWQTTQRWPEGTVDTLKNSGLLRSTHQAESMECWKCEDHCCLDVIPITHEDKPTRYFMVCDDPEMQGRVGRIKVPVEQLQQWRITTLQLAKLVAKLLKIENKIEQQGDNNHIRIGMIDGGHGRKWLLLNLSSLELEINGHITPLIDALFFDNGNLQVDRERFQYCAGNASKDHKKPSSSSTAKQEARKLNTQARDEDIQQAYLEIRKKHPRSSFHTDQWVAKQISKLAIAQGATISRIIRIMKG